MLVMCNAILVTYTAKSGRTKLSAFSLEDLCLFPHPFVINNMWSLMILLHSLHAIFPFFLAVLCYCSFIKIHLSNFLLNFCKYIFDILVCLFRQVDNDASSMIEVTENDRSLCLATNESSHIVLAPTPLKCD